MIRKTSVAAALAAAAFALPAHAVDSVSYEYGWGNDDTFIWRLGVQWKWKKLWFAEKSWRLGAYWDLQLGHWSGQSGVTDVGITPVFRLERSFGPQFWPYLEAAVGFHNISNLHISTRRVFSTSFQYGDHIGAGLRFGEGQRWDFGTRLQHLSNGGLRHPNPGINFLQVRLQYHFQ